MLQDSWLIAASRFAGSLARIEISEQYPELSSRSTPDTRLGSVVFTNRERPV
jgi:hypothetical protein